MNKKLQNYGKKLFHQKEVKRRAGMAGSSLVNLRICNLHPWCTIRKSYKYDVVVNGVVNSSKTTVGEFKVPSDAGQKMNHFGTCSNGLGVERFQGNLLSRTEEKDEEGWRRLTQQYSEMEDARSSSPDSGLGCLKVSPVLLRASGLDCHPEFAVQPGTQDPDLLMLLAAAADETEPTITPSTINNREVKGRTRFKTLPLLLSYIAVVCNGDMERIMECETSLTWFEEWFLFFSGFGDAKHTEWTP